MLRQVVLLGLSGSANPVGGRAEEAGFAIGIAEMRNTRVLNGKIKALVVFADPRMLGELRKEYYKILEEVLVGEIPKDLTCHSIKDI